MLHFSFLKYILLLAVTCVLSFAFMPRKYTVPQQRETIPSMQVASLRYSVDPDYAALELLIGTWEISDVTGSGSFGDILTITKVGYDAFYDKVTAVGYGQENYFYECLIDEGSYTASGYTYICWNYKSDDGLNDDYYNFSFINSTKLQGMHYKGTFENAISAFGAGSGESVVAQTPGSSSSEEILTSDLNALKNTLLSTGTYTVSGSFASYDFAGVDTAFDWTFTTPDNQIYQLQGNTPTSTDVFGWKAVSVTPDLPAWYMSYLGDWDSDGNSKYDWILVGNGFDAVYKLEGVTATGTFAYSIPLAITYTLSSDKKHIAFGDNPGGDLSDPALPGSVVKRALEAQARGDVNALLAECDMSGYSQSAQTAARNTFNVIKEKAAFSNFVFEHRVSGTDPDEKVATVRAVVSFTMKTPDGSYTIHEGVLTFLNKISGVWKIRRIMPDDLLNQELYEASTYNAKSSAKKHQTRAVVNLQKLNEAIDTMLRKGYLKADKLALDTAASGVGATPLVGDFLALAYEGLDTANDSWEAFQELKGNGLTFVSVLKVAQIGAGIVQMVTEPIPGADAFADAVGIGLEQFTHEYEILRDLHKIKQFIREIPAGTVQLNPYLFTYEAYAFLYPGGFEAEAPLGEIAHSYGTPLGSIRITKPEAFDELIPLRVVGEIPFSAISPLASAIIKLGGKKRGDTLYFPVEVGYLVASDANHGDQIFDKYHLYEINTASTKLAGWSVTCRRGVQTLAVKLQNGEVTPDVYVSNDLMNNVDELSVPGLDNDIAAMNRGQTLIGLRVIGKGTEIEERFWPDLTDRSECLDMAIDNSNIATFQRENTMSISGMNEGETTLKLLLGGSSELSIYHEIEKSVPVVVCAEGVQIDNGECVNASSSSANASSSSSAGTSSQSAQQWVLKETVVVDECKTYSHECYPFQYSIAEGSFSFSGYNRTDGVCSGGVEGQWSASASYILPPGILLPGEKLPIGVDVSGSGATYGITASYCHYRDATWQSATDCGTIARAFTDDSASYPVATLSIGSGVISEFPWNNIYSFVITYDFFNGFCGLKYLYRYDWVE